MIFLSKPDDIMPFEGLAWSRLLCPDLPVWPISYQKFSKQVLESPSLEMAVGGSTAPSDRFLHWRPCGATHGERTVLLRARACSLPESSTSPWLRSLVCTSSFSTVELAAPEPGPAPCAFAAAPARGLASALNRGASE
ncbi:hypothetical protein CB1_000273036 [Camelus ferus]|nr:hypothetical protein CB1_000273036 [Camelus ferus]